jgi:hypothetical protein
MQVTEANGFDAAPFEPGADRLATRDAIAKRKEEMLASPHLVELPFAESLAGGLYTRTLFIPKGCELVGKIHRKPCVNIVAKGDITIMTETGLLRVQAGYSVTSPAGIQKIGFAHEDTIFINVFRTDVTDIGQVEKDLICESFEALGAEEQLCLG